MTTEALEAKQQSGKIEGWYILEIFGHQRYAGYVTVEQLGVASMIRIDVPPLEPRERVTKRSEYVQWNESGGSASRTVPARTRIQEGPVQGYTKLFGVGAIYAMTPCTQEACMKAVEEMQSRPMMRIELPPDELPPDHKALAAPVDRTYKCCGGTPETGHEDFCDQAMDEDEDEMDTPI